MKFQSKVLNMKLISWRGWDNNTFVVLECSQEVNEGVFSTISCEATCFDQRFNTWLSNFCQHVLVCQILVVSALQPRKCWDVFSLCVKSDLGDHMFSWQTSTHVIDNICTGSNKSTRVRNMDSFTCHSFVRQDNIFSLLLCFFIRVVVARFGNVHWFALKSFFPDFTLHSK